MFKKLSWSFIRKVSMLAVAIFFVLFAGISTLLSWLEYVDYYSEMIVVKDAFTDANSAPVTVMEGITITYAEGVEFFDNGKANPNKKSFVVMGCYSVDGREYQEEITDYELTIPEDFAKNGGEIQVSYLHSETKTFEEKTEVITENGTEIIITPVEKTFERTYTATLDVVLTAVVPSKLVIVQNPNIVCYKENDTFSKTGMAAVVEYNDGSIYEDVNVNDVVVGNTSPLSTDVDSVKLTYELDGVIVEGIVDVKVMTEQTFTNGEIIDLFVEGGVSVVAGQPLSSAFADVRVKYSSGNVLPINEYEKTFGTTASSETAKIGAKYVMQVKTPNNIIKKFGVSVVSRVEAESATLSNCSPQTSGSDVFVGNFVNGASMTFSLTSTEATYVELYANMSNGYITKSGENYYANAHSILSIMQVRVNGKLRAIADTVMPMAGPYQSKAQALGAMRKVYLGKVFVQVGTNEIALSFRNDINGLTDCDGNQPFGKIDYIETYALSGKVFNSFSDYISLVVADQSVPAIKVSKQRNWGALVHEYIMGSTTDGVYIYYMSIDGHTPGVQLADGKWSFNARIVKYDQTTDTIVGYSAAFPYYSTREWSKDLSTKLFYKSGYVYTYNAQHEAVKIAVDKLNTNGTNALELAPENGFNKNDFSLDFITMSDDIQYCAARQQYAMVSQQDGYVHIYNADYTEERYFKFATNTPFKIALDEKYLYIMSATIWDKATYTTDIYVYTWEGEMLYKMTANTTAVSPVKVDGTDDSYGGIGNRYSERTLVMVGSSLYLSARGWGTPWQSGIFKIDFNYAITAETEILSLGEYVEACKTKGVSIKYTAQALNNSAISGVPRYTHGFCTDGEFVYVAANEGLDSRIYKVDMTTKKLVGMSVSYTRLDDWNNADYVYYKDGYVYVIQYNENRTLGRVKCADMDMEGTAPIEQVANFVLSQDLQAKGNKPHSATYNATQNKYAVVLTSKNVVAFFNGTTMAFEKSATLSAGTTVLGVSSDENYVYILYEKQPNATDKTVAGLFVMKWDGTEVANLTMTNLNANTSATNVQGIYVKDGIVYLSVNNWGRNGMIVTRVDLDYSVLG